MLFYDDGLCPWRCLNAKRVLIQKLHFWGIFTRFKLFLRFSTVSNGALSLILKRGPCWLYRSRASLFFWGDMIYRTTQASWINGRTKIKGRLLPILHRLCFLPLNLCAKTLIRFDWLMSSAVMRHYLLLRRRRCTTLMLIFRTSWWINRRPNKQGRPE